MRVAEVTFTLTGPEISVRDQAGVPSHSQVNVPNPDYGILYHSVPLHDGALKMKLLKSMIQNEKDKSAMHLRRARELRMLYVQASKSLTGALDG